MALWLISATSGFSLAPHAACAPRLHAAISPMLRVEHPVVAIDALRDMFFSSDPPETDTEAIALPALRISYAGAALCLLTASIFFVPAPIGMNRAVLGSTALALLADFGPSAVQDIGASNAAKDVAVEKLVDAMPPMILVNNFVQNLGPKDEEQVVRQQAETKRLESVNKWTTLVRSRVMADAIGVLTMLNGGRAAVLLGLPRSASVCLGAGVILGVHAACWIQGTASARMTPQAEPAPISPPLARLIGAATAMLAFAATTGAVGRSAYHRLVGGWTYAVAMTVIQIARLVADVVRKRTHVGI